MKYDPILNNILYAGDSNFVILQFTFGDRIMSASFACFLILSCMFKICMDILCFKTITNKTMKKFLLTLFIGNYRIESVLKLLRSQNLNNKEG